VGTFTIHDLAQACRIYFDHAYPGAAAEIPANKSPYHCIPNDASLDAYLPPAKIAVPVCQKLKCGATGYQFRLGSAAFPHMKLAVQAVDLHGREVWVYSVDTHDQAHLGAKPIDEEEAAQWRALVEQNRRLKQQIEEALALAGFLTPKGLLRIDLTPA
jgi:hypothetical protein